MIKAITVGNNTLTVSNLYPYRYDYGQGKEVLRIEIERTQHGYTEIEAALENPATDIAYLEDDAPVCAYKGYIRDYKCSYQSGVYSVELTRVTPIELEVEELKAKVAALEAQSNT